MARYAFMCLALALWPAAALSEGWALAEKGAEFERVEDRDRFVQIISQGSLNRFGMTLVVQPDGRIDGRAFGRDVSGKWQWRDGYFCRDLSWGSRDLGPNCQEVKVSGEMVRFTSDQGSGDFADLRLK